MTMSYIVFANPHILENAGLPLTATIGMTALAAAIPTLAMGLWANYPFALAPGMGLNAFLAFEVCAKMGYSWRTGMGFIFIEGLIVTLFVLTRGEGDGDGCYSHLIETSDKRRDRVIHSLHRIEGCPSRRLFPSDSCNLWNIEIKGNLTIPFWALLDRLYDG